MRPDLLFAVPLSLAAALVLVAGTARAEQSQGTPPATQVRPAPRAPVQQSGGGAHPQTPVVKGHADQHRQKPGAAPAKAEKTKPPAAVAKPDAAAPAPAQPEEKTEKADKLPDPEKPEGAVPKLPRFASLRSDEVNMRVGPGTRYRIEWVYKRRDLPVEIEREFDVWRWVEDPDGIKGWVHQATLMGRRSFIVQKADATLRSEPSESGSAVAVLKPGVIGRIRSCDATSDWCNVQTASYRGYLRRSQFWGTLPGEAVGP